MSPTMKKWFIITILMIAAFLIVFFVVPNPVVYNLLSLNQIPEKSSVVYVLCGGSGKRALFGASLIDRGYSDTLILTGTKDEIRFVTQILSSWIERTPARVLTYELPTSARQARTLSRIVGKKDNGKVIVVSSAWHLRRVRLITMEHCGHTCLNNIYFTAVPFEDDSVSKMPLKGATKFLLIERAKCITTYVLTKCHLGFLLQLFEQV